MAYFAPSIRSALLIVLGLVISILFPPQQTHAAMGDPVDGEILINTAFRQTDASVAMDADGDFIIVWRKFNNSSTDDSPNGIYAQRYHKDGNPNGAEFQVSRPGRHFQTNPDVAMSANGRFVVVWEEEAVEGEPRRIFGRLYDESGNPLDGPLMVAGEFLVSADTEVQNRQPAVAMDAYGGFVVAWERARTTQVSPPIDIYKRDYNFVGTPNEAVQANTNPSFLQRSPDVAMNADGAHVIVWESRLPNNTAEDIYARSYSSLNLPLSESQFRINSFDIGDSTHPAVAMAANGRYVVSWFRRTPSQTGNSSTTNVNARIFDSSDSGLGTEFIVNNTPTDFNFSQPAIATDANGDFVIFWLDRLFVEDGSGDSFVIRAQLYHDNGDEFGDEFVPVGQHPEVNILPAVAMNAFGGFVGIWQSSEYGDIVPVEIHARRYASVDTVTVGSGTPESCDGGITSAFSLFVSGALKLKFDCGDQPYVFPFSEAQTITEGQAVEIDGEGLISFAASNETRLFDIQDDAIVLFKGLVLADGSPASSASAQGGAIRNIGGHLIGEEIKLIENRTNSPGGAIFVADGGSVQFTDCVIADNHTPGWGGGIYVDYSALYLNRCLLDGNYAGVDGGGIRVTGESEVNLLNTTLTNNQAVLSGGAVAVTDHPNITRIINNTVVRNQSEEGGGFFLDGIQSLLHFSNSIIASNSGGDCGKQTEIVNYTGSGHNIDSDASCWIEAENAFSTHHLSQLRLGNLSDNGGFSRTIPLFSGSVAIDEAHPFVCEDYGIVLDQRRVARDPFNCDVGAFEASAIGPGFSPTITNIGPIDINPADSLAVLIPIAENGGSPRAILHNPDTNNKVGEVGFTRTLIPLDMSVIPDLSNSKNGQPEIATLGLRQVSGNPIVNIRDPETRDNLGVIGFSSVQGAEKLLILPDGPDEGSDPEIGIIGPRGRAGRPAVEIRDSITKVRSIPLYFTRDLKIYDAVVLNDVNGNGAAEIAVVGKRSTSGEYFLQVRDSVSRLRILNRSLSSQYVPIELAALPDLNDNGSEEIALLSYNPREQVSRVQILDGLTKAVINNINFTHINLSKNHRAIGMAILPDSDDVGHSPEISVLLRRTDSHALGAATRVETRDALSSNVIGRVEFDASLTPLKLTHGSDANDNSHSEVSVLLYDPASGWISVTTRDSATGEVISKFLVSSGAP